MARPLAQLPSSLPGSQMLWAEHRCGLNIYDLPAWPTVHHSMSGTFASSAPTRRAANLDDPFVLGSGRDIAAP